MRVDQAVELLWQHGYRANASAIFPNWIVVLDPYVIQSGGAARRVQYERREIHVSRVWRFITERE